MPQFSISSGSIKAGSAALAAEQAKKMEQAAWDQRASAQTHVEAALPAAGRASQPNASVAVPNLSSNFRRERIFTPRPVAAPSSAPSLQTQPPPFAAPAQPAQILVNNGVSASQPTGEAASNFSKQKPSAVQPLKRFFQSLFARTPVARDAE